MSSAQGPNPRHAAASEAGSQCTRAEGRPQAIRVTHQSSTPKLKTSAACSRVQGVGGPVMSWESCTLIAKAHHAVITSSAALLHPLCCILEQLRVLLGAA